MTAYLAMIVFAGQDHLEQYTGSDQACNTLIVIAGLAQNVK